MTAKTQVKVRKDGKPPLSLTPPSMSSMFPHVGQNNMVLLPAALPLGRAWMPRRVAGLAACLREQVSPLCTCCSLPVSRVTPGRARVRHGRARRAVWDARWNDGRRCSRPVSAVGGAEPRKAANSAGLARLSDEGNLSPRGRARARPSKNARVLSSRRCRLPALSRPLQLGRPGKCLRRAGDDSRNVFHSCEGHGGSVCQLRGRVRTN